MRAERAEYLANLPRKRIGAGALFVDESDRVLLVEPTYKDYWELPGGAVEADESPYAAVVREVGEELGLAVSPGRLLVVDWVPPSAERTEGVMFVFDGGVLSGEQVAAISLPPEELRSWAWCDDDEVGYRMSGLLTRRVIAARRALRTDITIYLENGFAVGPAAIGADR
jgi:8-oxo-dGTP pyrophosphatase MutT (NUDIX family)